MPIPGVNSTGLPWGYDRLDIFPTASASSAVVFSHYGFVWAIAPITPTANAGGNATNPATMSKVDFAAHGASPGGFAFSTTISQHLGAALVPGTSYNIRPFAVNTSGVNHGQQQTVIPSGSPVVSTDALVTSLGFYNAIAGVTVSDRGGAALSSRGIQYVTPSGASNAIPPGGSAIRRTVTPADVAGHFTADFSANLLPGQDATGTHTYKVKGFAVNVNGTGFGADRTFRLPWVATTAVTAPRNDATLDASGVVHAGEQPVGSLDPGNTNAVTAWGFVYSTSNLNPTIADGRYDVAGPFSIAGFSGTIPNLQPATLYHVRAFAIMGGGAAYGSTVNVSTLISRPTLNNDAVTFITGGGATVGGTVLTSGGDPSGVSARGVVYNIQGQPNDIEPGSGIPAGAQVVPLGSGLGHMSVALTGLDSGQPYNVRAWATNAAGTSYAANVPFITAAAPTVVNIGSIELAGTSLIIQGRVTATTVPVVAEGFVYSDATADPNINDTRVDVALVANNTTFQAHITGLLPHHHYTFKAFADNGGVGYSLARGIVTGIDQDNVTLTAFCDLPWNSPTYHWNDTRLYWNQAEDELCTHAHNVELAFAMVEPTLDTPVVFETGAMVDEEVMLPGQVAFDIGAELGNRPFTRGSSVRGLEPRGRLQDWQLNTETHMVSTGGRPSDDVITYPPDLVPITNLEAFPAVIGGDYEILLAWEEHSSLTGIQFKVYQQVGANFVLKKITSSTGYLATGLTKTQAYTFGVIASHEGMTDTARVDITVPAQTLAAPTNFGASTTDDSALLSWSYPTISGVSFHVYQLVGAAYQLIRTTGTKSANITGLSAGTYKFQVEAFSGAQKSPRTGITVKIDASLPIFQIPIGAIVPDDGTADVTDKIYQYLSTHATNGQRIRFPPKRANGSRTKYRVDGGTVGAIVIADKTDVTIDLGGTSAANGTDGALFFQNEKEPYTAVGHDVLFIPTNEVRATYASNALAVAGAHGMNRTRNMWEVRNGTRVHIINGQIRGSNTGSQYDPDVEGQDGIEFIGGHDVAAGWMTIADIWGNGIEIGTPPLPSPRDHLVGCWLHDIIFNDFGRQCVTYGFGRNLIIERCSGGGSARTWLDAEPVASEIPAGQSTTVEGLYMINCSGVGHHGLGLLGLHPGVSKVLLSNCDGRSMTTSGVCFAEQVIIEFCDSVEVTQDEIPHYAFTFGVSPTTGDDNHTGAPFGGDKIIVRNNTGKCSSAIVHMGSSSVNNYLIQSNGYKLIGGQTAPATDTPPTAKGSVAGFTLPIPAHALRDA